MRLHIRADGQPVNDMIRVPILTAHFRGVGRIRLAADLGMRDARRH